MLGDEKSAEMKRAGRSIKVLAVAGAAGVAVAATAVPAGASKVDSAGNLVQTNATYHCDAKLLKGWFPPAVGYGLVGTQGTGECFSGTNFDHGIVDILHLGPSTGDVFKSEGAVQFNSAGVPTLATTPAPTNPAECNWYQARTRVWRRADKGKAATVVVESEVLFVGNCGKH
jgi:hypothetical protein